MRNKTLIGAFVFGSLVLVCLAFLMLGYGKFNNHRISFALFFDSSLRGLTIDSPVFFKGVPIGSVRSIYIVPNADGDRFKTVVIIELNGTAGGIDSVQDDRNFIDFLDNEEYVKSLIEQGLRAKLSTASLITGQLVIELAMVSNPDPLTDRERRKFHDLIQIPTLPNVFDSILSSVEDLPLRDISTELLHLLQNVNKTVADLDLPKLLNNINTAVENMNVSAKNLNSLENDSKKLIAEYRMLGETMNKKLPSILQNVEKLSRNGMKMTQDDSALMQEFFLTLQALREAANSITYLARLLENQPDALIFGKAK